MRVPGWLKRVWSLIRGLFRRRTLESIGVLGGRFEVWNESRNGSRRLLVRTDNPMLAKSKFENGVVSEGAIIILEDRGKERGRRKA